MKRIFTVWMAIFCLLSISYAQDNITHWVTHASSPFSLFLEGVSVDDEGNAFVTGFFNAVILFDGDTVAQAESERNSMFLGKLSPDNELLWMVTAEADGNQGINGFKTAYRDGNLYLMGDLRGTATFGSVDFAEQSITGNDYRTMFIARYTSGGLLEWVRTITTDNSLGFVTVGGTHDLAIDHQGSVYYSTQFRNSINIAGVEVEDPTPDDNLFNALLGKFDINGAYQWHWNTAGAGADQGQAIYITPDNTLLFTYRYSFGTNIYGNDTNLPGFAVAEFDLSGNYIWHQFMSTESQMITGVRCFDIALDDEQNIYLAGSYRTDINWDQQNYLETVNSARSDGFVIKIDGEERSWEWGINFGDPAENDDIKSMVFTSYDNFMLAGNFRGEMTLNDDLLLESENNSTDGFWAVMDKDGVVSDGFAFGGSSNETITQMAVAPTNDMYIAGRFQNDFQYEDEEFNSIGLFDSFIIKTGDIPSPVFLANILINGEPLPGFDTEVTSYLFSLPSQTDEVPVVEANPLNPASVVTVEQAVSLTGSEEDRTATITITSEDEEESQEYTVTFRLKSDDATLSALLWDENEVPDFDPELLEYHIVFYEEATLPVVTAIANDENATLEIEQASSLTGDEEERTATITVTAEDPQVQRTYTVAFRYAGTDATLSIIFLDGQPIEDFNSFEPHYILIAHPDELPEIEAVPNDEHATVEIMDPEPMEGGLEHTLIEIKVTAENPQYEESYFLTFRFPDANSLLSNIWVNDELLDGFEPETFDYALSWDDMNTLPEVDGLPESDLAEMYVSQVVALDGSEEERTATIEVTAEDGESVSVYTVYFDVETGVIDFAEKPLMVIYPNPAHQKITVQLAENVQYISVVNASGAEVIRKDNPEPETQINIAALPAGYYVITTKTQHAVTSSTGFIKK